MGKLAVSVTSLTQEIAKLLRDEIGYVRVVGEVSGLKTAGSGHRYFVLKDESAQIDCVLWGSRDIECELRDGLKVTVEGNLTVYSSRGKYQIDCLEITSAGEGDLYQAFAALKADLEAKGYFDEERKQALPALPMRIGVVTSAAGAALHDILSTLERRSPFCEVYVCPASVQGENAAWEIADAIATLNTTECEVLIVGRGGGSIEDLWAFNTLPVAEAIYESAIPIVSAVGHQTDFTIADFVADVRAATPTAAAELVTQLSQAKLLELVDALQESMQETMRSHLERYQQKLNLLSSSYGLQALPEKLRQYDQRLDEAEERMKTSMYRNLQQSQTKLSALEAHLHSLHPLAPLSRGFALLRHGDQVIDQSVSLSSFTEIEIIRQAEIARATVDAVQARAQDNLDLAENQKKQKSKS